ADA
ncbi:hypothetical protein MK372_02055, partial [Streptococcus oralis]